MSAKISGLVWELALPREEKYVLLCLADHAKHDGTDVYPSIGRIAWMTDYSERRVQEIMRQLEARKILVKVEERFGRGNTNVYRIDLDAASFKEPRTKGAKISSFSAHSQFRKGEIPQGQKDATGRVKGAKNSEKGELASAPEPKEPYEPKSLNPAHPRPCERCGGTGQRASFTRPGVFVDCECEASKNPAPRSSANHSNNTIATLRRSGTGNK